MNFKLTNNFLLRKCKSLSNHLVKSASYSSLRSNYVKDIGHMVHQEERIEVEDYQEDDGQLQRDGETIYVGSSRRRYVITAKYLSHPVVNALIEKSSVKSSRSPDIHVMCEVVLFEHLLWMLDNASSDFSLEELADLYVF